MVVLNAVIEYRHHDASSCVAKLPCTHNVHIHSAARPTILRHQYYIHALGPYILDIIICPTALA